jgi:formylglycine-generating enzyme required for sulfatase activity
MNLSTLRDLSRAYALGSVDRETYRKLRHDLLTRVVAGELPVLPFQPPEPEQRTVFPYEDDGGDTTQEILAPLLTLQSPGTSAPRSRGKLVLVTVMVMVVVAAGVWALREFSASAPTVPTVTLVPAGPAAAQDLFAEFLSANQWQSAPLAALGARWNSLDEAARQQLRTAPTMRRLIDKTLEQIQAERALMALGDADEALANQQQLLELMAQLGAQDPRLSRAREVWQAAHAERQKLLTETVNKQAPAPDETALAPATETPAAPKLEPPAEVTSADVSPAPPAVPAPTAVATTPTLTPTTVVPTPVTNNTPTRVPKNARNACNAGLAKTRRPYCQDVVAALGKGPALVVLPAGEFVMGGLAQEEQPQHPVRFERAFAIALFEVSVAEFTQFCAATQTVCPTQPWVDASLPIVNVSWAAANAYTQWLSKSSGANYRLPTEAEWEYAARAGTTTPYPFGSKILPTHARYSFKNLVTTPLPANDRSVNRNDFKLYHMLGNVREWVADGWHKSYDKTSPDGHVQAGGDGRRVARGGSYADSGAALRSAARVPLEAAGDQFTGFRVVREIE